MATNLTETYARIAEHVLRALGVMGEEEFVEPMREKTPTEREIGEVFNSSMISGLKLANPDLLINTALQVIDDSILVAYREHEVSLDRMRQIAESHAKSK
jgi:hypothetical protein